MYVMYMVLCWDMGVSVDGKGGSWMWMWLWTLV